MKTLLFLFLCLSCAARADNFGIIKQELNEVPGTSDVVIDVQPNVLSNAILNISAAHSSVWLSWLATNETVTASQLHQHTNNVAIHLSPEQITKIDLAITSAPPQSVVSVNGQTGAVAVTAQSIGAITEELDPVALRTYHYGSPDIVESPAEWFEFDGTGTITGFNWVSGRKNVVIPWQISGVTVSMIGDNVFRGFDGGFISDYVETLIGPKTLTYIGDHAISYCTSLTNVILPSVKSFGRSAFIYCNALVELTLPCAESFGDYPFNYCSKLKTLTFSRSVLTYGSDPFLETTGVTVYVDNPTAIGWNATWAGRPVVRLGVVGDTVMANTSMTLAGETITTWPTVPVTSVNGNIGDVVITESDPVATQLIAAHTNNTAIHLTSVDVEQIAEDTTAQILGSRDLAALRLYHYGDENIIESPSNLFWFDEQTGTILAISSSDLHTDLVIPWEINGVTVVAMADNASKSLAYLETVVGPKTLQTIGDNAFYQCPKLKSVHLYGAEVFGDDAFKGLNASTVVIPNAKVFGDGAFRTSNISTIAIPNAKVFGDSAFRNSFLVNVDIESVETFGDYAFAQCNNLLSISGKKVLRFGSHAIISCMSLTNAIFDSVKVFGDQAFGACESLQAVSFHNLSEIGVYGFANCPLLESVTVSSPQQPITTQPIFNNSTNVVVYVTDPTADAWGTTWGGRPVVRLPVTADALTANESITLNGHTITNWPAALVQSVNNKTGEVVITAGELGALTQETDTIALPLLATHTNDAAIHLTPEQANRIANAVTNEQDLAALRTYHYGSPDIIESPAEWFTFDASTGTITGFNWQAGREHVVIPWQIGGVSVVKLDGFMWWGDNEVISVAAPKSVTTVDNSFYSCLALTSVTFSGSPPVIHQNNFAGSFNVVVYVDNPTATGWGSTFAGRPVVRLPVTADSYTLNGQTITEWPAAPDTTSPHTAWTSTLTPVDNACTLTPVDGNQPYLHSSSVTTVTVDWARYPTNGISRIALTLSGAGPYLFTTNNIAFVGEPELATNGYNRILIYRTADEPIGTAAILPGGGQ